MTSVAPMPEIAKVLPFRTRPSAPPNARQLESLADAYLRAIGSHGEESRRETLLECVDLLLSVCNGLRERVDREATLVASESIALYRGVGRVGTLGSFDERDYFLGETALISAIAHRV